MVSRSVAEPKIEHCVLVLQDDNPVAETIQGMLSENQVEVSVENDSDRAIERLQQERDRFHLIFIGMCDSQKSILACRRIRSRYSGSIMIWSPDADENREVAAIQAGADDFVSSLKRPQALMARVHMHLRKTAAKPAVAKPIIRVHGVCVDPSSRTVLVDGEKVELTTAEFDLLWLLVRRAGEVVRRNTIFEELIGIPYDGLDRSVDLRVSRLRKKIGDNPNSPQRIKSVRGAGYLFAKGMAPIAPQPNS